MERARNYKLACVRKRFDDEVYVCNPRSSTLYLYRYLVLARQGTLCKKYCNDAC